MVEFRKEFREGEKMTEQQEHMKLVKEQIFDIIDEYNGLKNKRCVVKFKGEKNRVKGFYIIMKEGCFSNAKNEFHISELARRKLDKAKIKYTLIR